MSRALKSVESEQAALASALTAAHSAVEKSSTDVAAAEARVIAVSTSADPKALTAAESALRTAESVRASALRRIELIEEAAHRTADEADAIRRGDAVAALRAERASLGARFAAAEAELLESLTGTAVALSKLEAAYQRDRVTERELGDLGAKPEEGSPCFGPWSGSPPYRAGVDLVDRAWTAAAERLDCAPVRNVPIALHVPVFDISPE